MKNVALVLSSGGARGLAHIGVIKTLVKHGYTITSISGTSMGSMVGGFYAAGKLNEFEEWVCTLDIREIIRLTDFSISKKGLIKGIKIFDQIKQIVPEQNIEDLSIPFCAIATNLLSGKEKVFDNGSLYKAIRASVSIPNVFQPYQIASNYYVDGGLLNPLPIDHVKRNTDDLLVVSDVNSNILPYIKPSPKQPDSVVKNLKSILKLEKKLTQTIPANKHDNLSYFNLTTKSIQIMLQRISELMIERYKPDIIVNISKNAFGPFDFYKASEIIQEGVRVTESVLLEKL